MSSLHIGSEPRPTRSRATLAFAAAGLTTVFAASSAPTPLYRLYQDHWSMAPVMLTVIFALYALGMLVALLTVGSLSDHIGRKRVILGSLILNLASLALFMVATSPHWLIGARLLQGFATGIAVTALGAQLLDVERQRGPMINAIAPLTGMALGALGSGILVAYAPAPFELVYGLLALVYAVQVVVVMAWIPETVAPRPGAWASLRPQIVVPARARTMLLTITPANIAIWALGGFYLSLMPSLIRTATGLTSPMIGGVVVAALTLSGGIAILALRLRHSRQILMIGTTVLSLGVAVTLWGVHRHSIPWMLAGTLIAGFGWGGGFFGSMRAVMPLAEAHERGALLAALYVESYLAFSLPAIAVGFAAPLLGLEAASYIYGGAVIVLSLISLAAAMAAHRHERLCTA